MRHLPDQFPLAARELRAPGRDWQAIPHGFASRNQPVAAGFALARVKQVHGAAVVVAAGDGVGDGIEADALITGTAGVAVAVATADCVPILLTTSDGRAVGAVHAGWRGTLAGIAGEAVARMRERLDADPAELRAAIGPAIDDCCFELEREIAARFADRFGAEVWDLWRDDAARPGKGRLDLRAVNELQLERAGVRGDRVARVGPCTFCGEGGFASYRRDAADAGRQLSWIGISRTGSPG